MVLIGILLKRFNKNITEDSLRSMTIYTYPEIEGKLIVFALDKVNKDKGTIEGYCFNRGENRWDWGNFPFPTVIFRRIGLNKAWREYFNKVLDNRFFNNYYFDKWEMYQWFSKDRELNDYLPYTTIYNSFDDLKIMMERFKEIYIKPIGGMQGRNVFKLIQGDGRWVLSYRKKGENIEESFFNFDDLKTYALNAFKKQNYIFQEGIKLKKYQERVIDLRIIMQKNESLKWTSMAAIARIGAKDSVVSNISNDGTAVGAAQMLKYMMGFEQKEIYQLLEKMRLLSFKACNYLDSLGVNCCTLGLDIALDEKQRLYLLEINNRDPDPTIALNINDRVLYYKLKAGPIYYGKGLAEFGSENNAL